MFQCRCQTEMEKVADSLTGGVWECPDCGLLCYRSKVTPAERWYWPETVNQLVLNQLTPLAEEMLCGTCNRQEWHFLRVDGRWECLACRVKQGDDRILIIAGEPALRMEFTTALTQAGFTVADASNYPEAMSKLDEFKPDLAIMEDVCLSREQPQAQIHALGVPIILFGEEADELGVVRAVVAGADCYLRKPVSYLEVAARVKALLRRCGR